MPAEREQIEQRIKCYEIEPHQNATLLKAEHLMGMPARVTVASFGLLGGHFDETDTLVDELCFADIAEFPEHVLEVSIAQFWYINWVGPRITLYPNGQHILLYGTAVR